MGTALQSPGIPRWRARGGEEAQAPKKVRSRSWSSPHVRFQHGADWCALVMAHRQLPWNWGPGRACEGALLKQAKGSLGKV